MRHKLVRLVVVGGAVMAADQLSKAWAVAALRYGCEVLERSGPTAPALARCHPAALALDLGEAAATEVRMHRGLVPFFTVRCQDGTDCLRGTVRLGEAPPGTRVTRVERDPVDDALLLLRGVPLEADHLTGGPDGQLYRVVARTAAGAESSLRLRYRSPTAGVDVVPGHLRLRYVENPGAAWGFLADGDERFRGPFFVAVSVLATLFLLAVYRRTPASQRLFLTALALIFGGALGNFADRLQLGRVIDFIEVHWQDRARWPTFNVADVAITLGVACLLWDGLSAWRRHRRDAATSAAAADAAPGGARDGDAR